MEAKASSLKNQIQDPFIPFCKVILNADTSTFLVGKENSVAVFLAFGTLGSSLLLAPFSWPGFPTLSFWFSIHLSGCPFCFLLWLLSLQLSSKPPWILCLSLGLLIWSILYVLMASITTYLHVHQWFQSLFLFQISLLMSRFTYHITARMTANHVPCLPLTLLQLWFHSTCTKPLWGQYRYHQSFTATDLRLRKVK